MGTITNAVLNTTNTIQHQSPPLLQHQIPSNLHVSSLLPIIQPPGPIQVQGAPFTSPSKKCVGYLLDLYLLIV